MYRLVARFVIGIALIVLLVVVVVVVVMVVVVVAAWVVVVVVVVEWRFDRNHYLSSKNTFEQ